MPSRKRKNTDVVFMLEVESCYQEENEHGLSIYLPLCSVQIECQKLENCFKVLQEINFFPKYIAQQEENIRFKMINRALLQKNFLSFILICNKELRRLLRKDCS